MCTHIGSRPQSFFSLSAFFSSLLGYKTEELGFKLIKEGDLFKAQSYPKQQYGKDITYGGHSLYISN